MSLATNSKPQEVTRGPEPHRALKGEMRHIIVASILLLVVALIAYGGTATTGFSCDDFDNLSNCHKMLNGQLQLFWINLSGCFLDAPVYGLHYRPFLQFPFIADMLLWGANPIGWHISNFGFHWVASVGVYLVGMQLSRLLPEILSPDLVEPSSRNSQGKRSRQSAEYLQELKPGSPGQTADDELSTVSSNRIESAPIVAHPESMGSITEKTARGSELVPTDTHFSKTIEAGYEQSEGGVPLRLSTMRFSGQRYSDKFQSTIQSCASLIDAPALVGAILFAVNPLHAEALNWIVARVDSVCCVWYLLSAYAFFRSHTKISRGWTILSVVAFAVALGTKEAAAPLPLVLLFFEKVTGCSWSTSIRKTLPYWFVLAMFLSLRALALHMLVGGYLSSTDYLSVTMLKSFFGHPFALPFLKYVLFPVPSSMIPEVMPALILLGIGYALLLISALHQALSRVANRESVRPFLFLCGWFVIALIPIVPIFTPLHDMISNRMLYIPAVPLCLMFGRFAWSQHSISSSRLARYAGVLAFVLVGLSYAFLSEFNTGIWRTACNISKNTARVLGQYASECAGTKIVIMELPRCFHGAHIHYLLSTLKASMFPPFSNFGTVNGANKLQALEPNWVVESGLVNLSAMRRMLRDPSIKFCNLDQEGSAVRVRSLKISDGDELPPIVISKADSALSVREENGLEHITINFDRPINPLQFPLLEVEFDGAAFDGEAYLYVKTPNMTDFTMQYARTVKPLVLKRNKLLLHLGELNTWVTNEGVDRFCLSIPLNGRGSVPISKVSLTGDSRLVPGLEPCPDLVLNDVGAYTVTTLRGGNKRLEEPFFTFDVNNISGAVGVEAEVSGPFHRFTNDGAYRETTTSFKARKRIVVQGQQGRIVVPTDLASTFNCRCWYSMRVFARDRDGKVIGLSSDPVFVTAGD